MALVILESETAKVGGASTFSTELLPRLQEALRARGHQVSLLTGPPVGLNERGRRAIQIRRSDAILHAGNRATLACRAKQVVCVRNRLLLPGAPRLYGGVPRFQARRALLWQAVRSADLLVTPSQSMVPPLRSLIRRIRPSPAARVIVIPHGGPRWQAPADRSLGQPLRLLFPSHVAKHKNFPFLVEVLRELHRRGIDARLTLTASAADATLGQRLGSIFDPVRDSVFFRGAVPHRELADLYAQEDICVFASLCESFGMPLVEAMAMNMPIIASNKDWAREICGPAAVYADPHDPNQWVDAVEHLLCDGTRQNPEGLVRKKRFSWDRSCNLYAEQLEQCLG